MIRYVLFFHLLKLIYHLTEKRR